MKNHPRPRALVALVSLMLALLPTVTGGSHAAAAAGDGRGYWFVAGDGGIFSYGDAGFHGSTGDMVLNRPIVGMAPTPTGKGYWFVASDGGIFAFGDARFHGSTGAMRLNRPIVGMAATPTGKGYWFVASDGGIFAFGDARFHGSTGATRLNSPIVGMAATPTGNGYWFVASDGGIFAFGDAAFYGSGASRSLRSTMAGMAATPSGRGYWLVASDGSVHSFGDAFFYGSMGGYPLSRPVVGLTPTPTGQGYWLVASDGGIFAYGDAGFYGSTGHIRLNQPIVGMAAVPPRSSAGGPPPGGSTPTTGGPGATPTTQPPGGGPTTTTTAPTTPTTVPPPGSVDWGAPGTTTRVAKAASGGGGSAYRPWLSGDGRYLVFDSDATRVIGGVIEPDSVRDVYMHDRVAGTYEKISETHDGSPPVIPAGGRGSWRPTVSADGRWVAFWSDTTNLVPGDTNDHFDAFLHDRQTGTTKRISVGPDNTQATGDSQRPVVSRDGRFVAFESDARNLIAGGLLAGGDRNNAMDVFVYEVATGEVTRVSVSSSGAEGNGGSTRPSISGDGRYVAFDSAATNLVAGDTNSSDDIFVHDRQTGETRRVSVAADGTQANNGSKSPSITVDGRLVAFDTRASNLGVNDNNADYDIYVKDLQSGAVSRVSVASDGSQANDESRDASISGDGRFVSFHSLATDLVPGDTNGTYDAFVHDRQTGTTRRVSVSSAGAQADNESFSTALSVDGRVVAFDSKASNLDGGGSSNQDVFVHAL